MTEISLKMTIKQILTSFPETLTVFVNNGFSQFGDAEIIKQFGSFLQLGTALKAKQVDPVFFLRLLEESIEKEKSEMRDAVDLDTYYEESNPLHFLAMLPCPVKVPLEKQFSIFIKAFKESGKGSLTHCIVSNANNHLSFFDYVRCYEHIDELPDVVIASGFNGFYHKSFMQRFKHQGLFADTDSYSEETDGFGLQDPDKQYKIIAFNPAVMLVDLELLGTTQAPKKWEDILEPEFSNSVAVSGNDTTYYCEGLLLNFYKSFGIEGVRKLGRSIQAARHPAEMVKLMGSKKINAPTVSIIPYFFTKMVKKKDSIVVVWPEDGAIVNPITMLVKKAALNKVNPIASFMAGKLVGKIFAGTDLPSANPHVANKTPNGARYKWLGWDFIRDNDLEPLVEELNIVSRETKSYHRGNPAKCF